MPDFFDEVPGDTNAPYLFLDFLINRGHWTPSGGTPTDLLAYKQRFETLIQGGTAIDGSNNCQALMLIIPDRTPNNFDARGRTQNGFKFEWVGTDGSTWAVHAHEPDQATKDEYLASRRWIVRIRYAERDRPKKFFWMRDSLEPARVLNKKDGIQPARYWVPGDVANEHPTHIELQV